MYGCSTVTYSLKWYTDRLNLRLLEFKKQFYVVLFKIFYLNLSNLLCASTYPINVKIICAINVSEKRKINCAVSSTVKTCLLATF